MEKPDAWKVELEKSRIEKNKRLSTDDQSPIPFMKRRKFSGLSYFPLDSKYIFKLELHEHGEKKVVEIRDSKDNARKFICWGEFNFEMDGIKCTLQAYKIDSKEDIIFVPFKDATSSKETYGAGRYLDMEPKNDLSDGKWTLDFNKAYNPWCAYNHNYACTMAPPENWLDIPIEAGEKSYSE
ncbi:MAG: DUF1684 domain-containing protein [Thermoplasmata archaeon]|nr:DUF1684 domain-containing protein [Thermoplasmata archaeon]